MLTQEQEDRLLLMQKIERMSNDVSLEQAIRAALICSGLNAPNLKDMTRDSVLSERNLFLRNVSYNGARSHNDIIIVLMYMRRFIDVEQN